MTRKGVDEVVKKMDSAIADMEQTVDRLRRVSLELRSMTAEGSGNTPPEKELPDE